MACVLGSGSASEGSPVTNGTKQGCVLAPTLFSVLLTAMLHDTFKDLDKGVAIEFRFDGSIFNLRRLQLKYRISVSLIREFLFADDCVLVALQHQTNVLALPSA